MNERSLSSLGRVAFWFRRAGLQPVFALIRNVLDAVAVGLNYPPLSAEIDGVRLGGFLRHRSFLEELAKGSYEPMFNAWRDARLLAWRVRWAKTSVYSRVTSARGREP